VQACLILTADCRLFGALLITQVDYETNYLFFAKVHLDRYSSSSLNVAIYQKQATNNTSVAVGHWQMFDLQLPIMICYRALTHTNLKKQTTILFRKFIRTDINRAIYHNTNPI
jgi:hypothetical protein